MNRMGWQAIANRNMCKTVFDTQQAAMAAVMQRRLMTTASADQRSAVARGVRFIDLHSER